MSVHDEEAKHNMALFVPSLGLFLLLSPEHRSELCRPGFWMMALIGKTEPPKGKVGFAYMLMGGPAQSNLDPFATKPPEGSDWIMDRPHIMIVNFGDTLEGYPTKQEKPDTTQPYVMWGGTPYAHLMVPVH